MSDDIYYNTDVSMLEEDYYKVSLPEFLEFLVNSRNEFIENNTNNDLWYFNEFVRLADKPDLSTFLPVYLSEVNTLNNYVELNGNYPKLKSVIDNYLTIHNILNLLNKLEDTQKGLNQFMDSLEKPLKISDKTLIRSKDLRDQLYKLCVNKAKLSIPLPELRKIVLDNRHIEDIGFIYSSIEETGTYYSEKFLVNYINADYIAINEVLLKILDEVNILIRNDNLIKISALIYSRICDLLDLLYSSTTVATNIIVRSNGAESSEGQNTLSNHQDIVDNINNIFIIQNFHKVEKGLEDMIVTKEDINTEAINNTMNRVNQDLVDVGSLSEIDLLIQTLYHSYDEDSVLSLIDSSDNSSKSISNLLNNVGERNAKNVIVGNYIQEFTTKINLYNSFYTSYLDDFISSHNRMSSAIFNINLYLKIPDINIDIFGKLNQLLSVIMGIANLIMNFICAIKAILCTLGKLLGILLDPMSLFSGIGNPLDMINGWLNDNINMVVGLIHDILSNKLLVNLANMRGFDVGNVRAAFGDAVADALDSCFSNIDVGGIIGSLGLPGFISDYLTNLFNMFLGNITGGHNCSGFSFGSINIRFPILNMPNINFGSINTPSIRSC